MKDFKDELSQFSSRKTAKVVMPTELKHEEAYLHLTFCRWVKLQYPQVKFVRHEREKARSFFLQNLFGVYNNLEGLPDFEALNPAGNKNGFFLEFKKPGEKWLMKDGITVKKDYAHQYRCHLHLWSFGRVAYFCNNLEDAQRKFNAYRSGEPEPMQDYSLPEAGVFGVL